MTDPTHIAPIWNASEVAKRLQFAAESSLFTDAEKEKFQQLHDYGTVTALVDPETKKLYYAKGATE